MKIKQFIKDEFRILKKIKLFYLLLKVSVYDFNNVFNYSAIIKGQHKNKNTLLAAISIDYHKIEKALTLNNIRKKFGQSYIPRLINNILLYKNSFGEHRIIDSALVAIKAYINYHKENGIELQEFSTYFNRINQFLIDYEFDKAIYELKREDIEQITNKFDFDTFVKHRHSIRSFNNEIIEKSTIEEAIKIAIQTPSVCNRQPWRAYLIQDKKKINNLLKYQNGNRGFDDQIRNLIIVVGKLSNMQQVTERNQVFIDGGMFSMSLIYALYSLNIGTCALNWCVEPKTNEKLKRVLELKEDELPMMYIACGKMNDEFFVTNSPRLSVQEVLSHRD